ncbi:hypothetical protein MMEU_4266 [Mycobacterium marinum str. Europe]|nr:hypothetical protein MMEU_4266 [Mycobacterium marinum str. Europe]
MQQIAMLCARRREFGLVRDAGRGSPGDAMGELFAAVMARHHGDGNIGGT